MELALHRMVSPIVSHVPGIPGGASTADVIRAGGEATLRATAVAIPAAVLAVAAVLWRRRHLLAVLLVAGVGLYLAYDIVPGAHLRVVLYTITIITVVVAVVTAAASLPKLHAAALAVLALGITAGVWPHVANAAGSAGLFTGGAGDPAVQRAIGEATFAGAFGLFGLAAVRRGLQRRATPWVAGLAGLITATTLATQPGHAAIMSLWATGLTLTLSPFVYVIAAMGLAAALAEWTTSVATRHWVAGLTLLAVVGVSPAMMHHNLGAVFAVALLALPPNLSTDT
ncbi:MAG: hypothetical protein GY720_08680 [bacterium]|nr:hypothetical protein [bacterium]